MDDPMLFQRHSVEQIDIKGIFERAAGRPAEPQTRTIVCGDVPATLMDNNRTLNGVMKPGSFTLFPGRRKEQYYV